LSVDSFSLSRSGGISFGRSGVGSFLSLGLLSSLFLDFLGLFLGLDRGYFGDLSLLLLLFGDSLSLLSNSLSGVSLGALLLGDFFSLLSDLLSLVSLGFLLGSFSGGSLSLSTLFLGFSLGLLRLGLLLGSLSSGCFSLSTLFLGFSLGLLRLGLLLGSLSSGGISLSALFLSSSLSGVGLSVLLDSLSSGGISLSALFLSSSLSGVSLSVLLGSLSLSSLGSGLSLGGLLLSLSLLCSRGAGILCDSLSLGSLLLGLGLSFGSSLLSSLSLGALLLSNVLCDISLLVFFGSFSSSGISLSALLFGDILSLVSLGILFDCLGGSGISFSTLLLSNFLSLVSLSVLFDSLSSGSISLGALLLSLGLSLSSSLLGSLGLSLLLSGLLLGCLGSGSGLVGLVALLLSLFGGFLSGFNGGLDGLLTLKLVVVVDALLRLDLNGGLILVNGESCLFLDLLGEGSSHSGTHGVAQGLLGAHLLDALANGLVLAVDVALLLLLQVDADLVVDERKHHAVVEGDERRGLMVLHLLLALHEDESTIGGRLLLALFADEPTLLVVVGDVAVISRDSLQLDLHLALHGAADGKVVVAVDGLQNDLFLDEVLVLVRADPGGAGAQGGGILLVFVRLLDDVVAGVGAHDVEGVAGGLRGNRLVSHLVEVVVHDLAEVDEGVLLDLQLSVHVHLYPGGVDHAEITDEVLAILAHDHKLRLPQFLVVRDLVVIGLALTDFEDTLGAVNGDFEVLELLGVDSLEAHVQLVGSGLVGDRVEGAAAEVDGDL